MPKTILIVEDDPDARDIYEEALKERGFEVLKALHGAEGVHLARRHRRGVDVLWAQVVRVRRHVHEDGGGTQQRRCFCGRGDGEVPGRIPDDR